MRRCGAAVCRPLTPAAAEYKTVTAVSGPLVVMDKVKARRHRPTAEHAFSV
jgi:hypothetical protein